MFINVVIKGSMVNCKFCLEQRLGFCARDNVVVMRYYAVKRIEPFKSVSVCSLVENYSKSHSHGYLMIAVETKPDIISSFDAAVFPLNVNYRHGIERAEVCRLAERNPKKLPLQVMHCDPLPKDDSVPFDADVFVRRFFRQLFSKGISSDEMYTLLDIREAIGHSRECALKSSVPVAVVSVRICVCVRILCMSEL